MSIKESELIPPEAPLLVDYLRGLKGLGGLNKSTLISIQALKDLFNVGATVSYHRFIYAPYNGVDSENTFTNFANLYAQASQIVGKVEIVCTNEGHANNFEPVIIPAGIYDFTDFSFSGIFRTLEIAGSKQKIYFADGVVMTNIFDSVTNCSIRFFNTTSPNYLSTGTQYIVIDSVDFDLDPTATQPFYRAGNSGHNLILIMRTLANIDNSLANIDMIDFQGFSSGVISVMSSQSQINPSNFILSQVAGGAYFQAQFDSTCQVDGNPSNYPNFNGALLIQLTSTALRTVLLNITPILNNKDNVEDALLYLGTKGEKVRLTYEQAVGVNGGDVAGISTYFQSPINTIYNASGYSWVSLSANQFTLSEGNYLIISKKVFWGVNHCTTRLYNASDSIATNVKGLAQYAGASNGAVCHLGGLLSVPTGGKAYEIQYFVNTSAATLSQGLPSGATADNQVYAEIIIVKVS